MVYGGLNLTLVYQNIKNSKMTSITNRLLGTLDVYSQMLKFELYCSY